MHHTRTDAELLLKVLPGIAAPEALMLLEKETFDVTPETIQAQMNLDRETAEKLSCLAALIKRRQYINAPILNNNKLVASYLCDIAYDTQENLILLTTDVHCRLIQKRTIYRGTYDHFAINPIDLFYHVINDKCHFFIIAHNHTSGDANPSDKDITFTQSLLKAAALLRLNLRDHIIVARDKHFSFVQNKLIDTENQNPGQN